MNLNDVPTNLPRATSSDVGAFIENGEIFGYLFSLLPESVQYVCNATNRYSNCVFLLFLTFDKCHWAGMPRNPQGCLVLRLHNVQLGHQLPALPIVNNDDIKPIERTFNARNFTRRCQIGQKNYWSAMRSFSTPFSSLQQPCTCKVCSTSLKI